MSTGGHAAFCFMCLNAGQWLICLIFITKQYFLDGIADLFGRIGSQHSIYFRNLFQNLIPVTFCQATANNQCFTVSTGAVLCHIQNGLDTFFFCIMDKTAGIDHDDVCLLLIVRYREFVMC